MNQIAIPLIIFQWVMKVEVVAIVQELLLNIQDLSPIIIYQNLINESSNKIAISRKIRKFLILLTKSYSINNLSKKAYKPYISMLIIKISKIE